MVQETKAGEGQLMVSESMQMQATELILGGGEIVSVSTDEEQLNCVEMLRKVKALAADIEAERDAKVRPLNEKVKAINLAYKPVIKELIGEKEDGRSGIAGNLLKVSAEYQIKKEQEAAEKERIAREEAEKIAEAERLRLAEIEQAKIAEEEKLRAEAEALAKAAETATGDAADDLKLQAAVKQEAADKAIQEACKASEAVTEVVAAPVQSFRVSTPIKAKWNYLARITDVRAAMKWIVENNEWSLIEGKKFSEIVESGMKKAVKNKVDDSNFGKIAFPGVKIEREAGK